MHGQAEGRRRELPLPPTHAHIHTDTQARVSGPPVQEELDVEMAFEAASRKVQEDEEASKLSKVST